eukprot:scaffold14820_cov428-Alexandrium_tamarense.AAC.7
MENKRTSASPPPSADMYTSFIQAAELSSILIQRERKMSRMYQSDVVFSRWEPPSSDIFLQLRGDWNVHTPYQSPEQCLRTNKNVAVVVVSMRWEFLLPSLTGSDRSNNKMVT